MAGFKSGVAALGFLFLGAQQPADWGDANEDWTSSPEYESSKALCRSLRDREPPAADRPDAATAAALKGCDSEALYYGIGMPSDPERARQCAFVEAEAAEEGVIQYPFSGRAMLMTIYANGRGAARDLDVAAHLACRIDGAPAESHGRVTHLAERKAAGAAAEEFHFCDDVTSGLAMGWCAHHAGRIQDAARAEELARISAGWTQAEKAAFARLERAHDSYAEAHADGEVDMSGTMRGVFWSSARQALSDELLDLVGQLSNGAGPGATAAQHRAADATLNAAYRERLAGFDGEGYGTVTKDGVRTAQRAWLAYRDAFLAFAAVKNPRASRDGIAAWLTRRRTALLIGQGE